MRPPGQLERRHYDPGVNPQPKNPRPRKKKAQAKKKPYLATDSARLREAEMRRRGKAAKRLADRVVVLGAAPAATVKPSKKLSFSKRRHLAALALKAFLRAEGS